MKFIMLCACCLMLLEAGALTVVRGKTSDYQIVIPDGTGNQALDDFTALGGKVIKTAVRKATGAELPLVKESKMIPGKPALFVGNTRALKKAALSSEKFAPWEHSIVVKGKNIYLFGKDLPNPLKKTKYPGYFIHYTLGSLKAVCTFAEKYLNTRFVGSAYNSYGENDGVRTLPLKQITVPDNLHYRKKPRFLTVTWDHGGLLYSVANNFLYNCGAEFQAHFHSIAIPQNKYYKEHPEYFALINGKRYFDTSGNFAFAQYCLSNPDVQDLIYRKAIEKIDSGHRIIELGQADGFLGCECSRCKAWYNTSDWGEKLWCYHRDLAERLQKERPGIEIAISCYGKTHKLPVSFKRFPGKGVLIDMAPPQKDLMEKLRGFNIRGIVGVTYLFGCYLPCGFSPSDGFALLQREMKKLHASPMVSLCHFELNQSRHIGGPWIYAWGKMLENPDLNWKQLLREYCRFAFGEKAAPWFMNFFMLIDRQMTAFPIGGFDPLDNVGLCRQSAVELWNKRYPPQVMKQLDKLFNEGLKRTAHGNFMVEGLKAEYKYMQLTAPACHAALAVQKGNSIFNRKKLAETLEKRNAFLNTLAVRSDNWIKGDLFRTKIHHLRRGGYMAGLLGEVFAADPDLFKSIKGIEIPVVRDFSDPAWKMAAVQKLVPVKNTTPEAAVSFRIARNAKELLLKLEAPCDVIPGNVKCERDLYKSIWKYAVWELFFATGQDQRHLAFNAVPGSAYDCITYPGGYRYLKWNPKWHHKDTVKNGVWYSETAIPLAALGNLPEPGERWRMQVGFSTPNASALYIWNPSLSGAFADLSGFGEIRFGKSTAAERKIAINGDFSQKDASGAPLLWYAAPGKVLLGREGKSLVMGGEVKSYLGLYSRVAIPVDGGEAAHVTVKLRGSGRVHLGCAWKDSSGRHVANFSGKNFDLTGSTQTHTMIFRPGPHLFKGATHMQINLFLLKPGGRAVIDSIEAVVKKESAVPDKGR